MPLLSLSRCDYQCGLLSIHLFGVCSNSSMFTFIFCIKFGSIHPLFLQVFSLSLSLLLGHPECDLFYVTISHRYRLCLVFFTLFYLCLRLDHFYSLILKFTDSFFQLLKTAFGLIPLVNFSFHLLCFSVTEFLPGFLLGVICLYYICVLFILVFSDLFYIFRYFLRIIRTGV